MISIPEGTKIVLIGNNESEDVYKEFIDSNYLKYNIVAIADNVAVEKNKYVRGIDIIKLNTAIEGDYFYVVFGKDWDEIVCYLEENKLIVYRDFLPFWLFSLYNGKSSISYNQMLSLVGEEKIVSALRMLNIHQKIAVIYGSKQMSNIVRFLTVTNSFVDDYVIITLPPAEAMERNHLFFPKELVEYAGLLVCQKYISKTNTKYNYDNIISFSRKRCKVIVVPMIFWDAYYPQACSETRHSYAKPKEDIPYRDFYIEKLFGEGSCLEEIQKRVCDYDLYSRDFLQTNLQKNMENMFFEEKECTVKIAQFVLDNHFSKKLFLAPDRPSFILYKELASKILEKIGYIRPMMKYQVIELEDCKCEMPIYPCIAAKLGLIFDQGRWIVSKQECRKELTIEQYISFYINTYFDSSFQKK